MSQNKKLIRSNFRTKVFARDGHKCRKCGITPENGDEGLDAHHITDRNELPNGGYVPQNGISLCPECHIQAEVFHCGGKVPEGFLPVDLYRLIGSSFETAHAASLKL